GTGRRREASILLRLMAARALDMVARAVLAFSTRNVELAATVRASRPVVDRFGERLVHDVLLAVRRAGQPPTGAAMRLGMVADHLEEIAGHAVSIAERVVSLVEESPRGAHRDGRALRPRSRGGEVFTLGLGRGEMPR